MNTYKYSQYNILIEQNNKFAIIYNCYNGGIIQLENRVFETIQQGEFSIDNIEYGEELLHNEFIVNANIDEFEKAKTQIENTIRNQNQDMISYVIAPTLNCNLRCVYCFQKDYRTDGIENIVTEEALFKIQEFILNYAKVNSNLKKIKITWFGGEPMLCFNQIVSFSKKLKESLSKLNIAFFATMITNGALLDEDNLKVLVDECNLRNVQITLDGEERTYCEKKKTSPMTFNKVLENVRNSTQYIKTTVRVNADKKNFDELQRLIKSLYISGVNKDNLTVHFAQLRDYECNNCEESNCYNDLEYWENKERFYSSLKDFDIKGNKKGLPSFSLIPFCGLASGGNLVIDYRGNLYKCEHYIGNETKIVGNITGGLFYNEVYKQSLKLATDKRCEKCNIFPCCNYSQCVAMHGFAGNEKDCKCYEKQLETLIQKTKKYLEEQ